MTLMNVDEREAYNKSEGKRTFADFCLFFVGGEVNKKSYWLWYQQPGCLSSFPFCEQLSIFFAKLLLFKLILFLRLRWRINILLCVWDVTKIFTTGTFPHVIFHVKANRFRCSKTIPKLNLGRPSNYRLLRQRFLWNLHGIRMVSIKPNTLKYFSIKRQQNFLRDAMLGLFPKKIFTVTSKIRLLFRIIAEWY